MKILWSHELNKNIITLPSVKYTYYAYGLLLKQGCFLLYGLSYQPNLMRNIGQTVNKQYCLMCDLNAVTDLYN